jgi:hypothetical protein
VNIITNHTRRPLINFLELTHKESKDFDYVTEDRWYDQRFFRYKGNVYDTQDCERPAHTDLFPGWYGYFSETFFSGVLFKYDKMFAYHNVVIVGRYYT